MNIGLYATSLVFHVLAAAAWIGGMLFMALVLVPGLRKLEDARMRRELIHATGGYFRLVGWVALAVLLVTGALNLIGRGMGPQVWLQAEFWRAGYGRMLAAKLLIFVCILAISVVHDWFIGLRANDAQVIAPGSPQALRLRRLATWFGRFNLLLSIAMLVLGILLSRGIT